MWPSGGLASSTTSLEGVCDAWIHGSLGIWDGRRGAGVQLVSGVAVVIALVLTGAGAAGAAPATFCVKATKTETKPRHFTGGWIDGTCTTESPTHEGKFDKIVPSSLSEGEQEELKELPKYVRVRASGVGGKPTVQVHDSNLRVVNGEENTATTNGEANLVIGYDENGGTETGSHNLIVGKSLPYSKRSGVLRVAVRCKRGEKSVSWNQAGLNGRDGTSCARGETGTAGTPGGPGLTGGTGATGPSDIYAAGTADAKATGSYASLGKVTVPPGSYLLEGKANFSPKEGVPSEGECTIEIKAEGAEFPEYWDVSTVKPTGSGGTMALSVVQTFTTPHSVSISCKLREGEGLFSNARIIAIQTGSLHGSTPTD